MKEWMIMGFNLANVPCQQFRDGIVIRFPTDAVKFTLTNAAVKV